MPPASFLCPLSLLLPSPLSASLSFFLYLPLHLSLPLDLYLTSFLTPVHPQTSSASLEETQPESFFSSLTHPFETSVSPSCLQRGIPNGRCPFFHSPLQRQTLILQRDAPEEGGHLAPSRATDPHPTPQLKFIPLNNLPQARLVAQQPGRHNSTFS